MSVWIEKKYLNLVSSQLKLFAVKTNNPFACHFRCPLCNDSAKKANKRRGNIYQDGNELLFKCFNCGKAHKFPTFLKIISPDLYKEFRFDNLKDANEARSIFQEVEEQVVNEVEETTFIPTLDVDSILATLKSIKNLPDRHPAKRYIVKRMIPEMYHSEMYFAPKFVKWTLLHTNKYEKMLDNDHPRLIIPFYDEDGKIFAWQARSFGDEKPKYLTWVKEKGHKPFGLNHCDLSKRIYVLEGPIDSMFIQNALAVYGSGMLSFRDDSLDVVYILDNEPRNKEILKIYQDIINEGQQVVIWPDYIEEKDINEMIQAGRPPSVVQDIIDFSIHRGLEAQMKFNSWKKV